METLKKLGRLSGNQYGHILFTLSRVARTSVAINCKDCRTRAVLQRSFVPDEDVQF